MDNAGFDKKETWVHSSGISVHMCVCLCVCDAVVGKSKIKIVDVQRFLHDSYQKQNMSVWIAKLNFLSYACIGFPAVIQLKWK